jgi:hypothetical protein
MMTSTWLYFIPLPRSLWEMETNPSFGKITVRGKVDFAIFPRTYSRFEGYMP